MVKDVISLKCDGCASVYTPPDYRVNHPRQVRRDASSQGWAYRRAEGRMVDLCPACLRILEREKKITDSDVTGEGDEDNPGEARTGPIDASTEEHVEGIVLALSFTP